MTHRMPVGRIIAGIVSGLLLALAVCLFVNAKRGYREFKEVQKAKPVKMEVDFGELGSYRGPFRHSYRSAHGVYLHLKFDSKLESGNEPRLNLDGLEGKVCIVDVNSKIIETLDFSADDFQLILPSDNGGRCPTLTLTYLPAEKGDYTLVVDINGAATALKNVRQDLTSSYIMCGMEILPAALTRLCGVISTGAAIAVISAIVVVTLKRRRVGGKSGG